MRGRCDCCDYLLAGADGFTVMVVGATPKLFDSNSLDHASKYGVTFVTQPGGSVADKKVIECCDEYGMTMNMTGLRSFHH